MNIGFIGLGIMGRPMAENLRKGGHALFLSSRSGVPEALQGAGVTACATAREVAEKAEIVILMVPDTPDVEKVLFGADGVAEGLQPGAVVVDMSSISPIETKEFARRIEEKGGHYLDAPVSGGEVGARAASLTIMVGGPEAVFERVKPLFELMGKNITRVGANGDGQTAKVANQIIVALTIEAVERSAAVRREGRRRSGARAPGADGRLRQFVEDPRGARRADDQAHVRPRASGSSCTRRT